jgi:hypothetical protein
MPRIVLLLLACLCSSLKAEYRWTGTEWEWVEPERAPLSPALQPAAAAEGSGDRAAGFSDDDDDYDDEDADPYGGKDGGDDEDDEDDDYYNNYDQKGKNKKKSDGKGKNNKDSGRLPVAPSPPASKGGKSGSGLPGKAPVPDKIRPDKQNKEVGKGSNNKKAMTTTTAPPPPMSRSKVGGGGGKFIPTDDEDLALEGSGDQDPDHSPYWEGDGGSGDGAPYGGGRNPAVTDAGGAASIDLDSEENTRKTSAAGGGGGVYSRLGYLFRIGFVLFKFLLEPLCSVVETYRNDLLRLRFRFLLRKSFGSGSGSGSRLI